MKYEFIDLGGEKFPIKFGFAALRHYSNITGTTLADLDKIGNNMTLDDALTLMYCGIKDGHRASKQEFDLDIDDIADLLDGNMHCLEKVFEVLGRQMSDGTEGKQKAKKAKKS